MNQFYKLTQSDLEIAFSLKGTELKVWLWLSVKLPFNNSEMEIDTSQIAEEVGISRRSAQRVLAHLQELQLFNLEWTKAKVSRTSKPKYNYATQMSSGDTDVVSATQMSSERQGCRLGDTAVVSATQLSPTRAETQTEKEFQNPQINKINKINKTLSDPREREKFLNFCRRKAEKFERPIVLLEKWVNKNFDELYSEYQKIHGQDRYSADDRPTEKKNPFIAIAEEAKTEGKIKDLYWSSIEKKYIVIPVKGHPIPLEDWGTNQPTISIDLSSNYG